MRWEDKSTEMRTFACAATVATIIKATAARK